MMRLDHVSYAVGPDGMDATVERISDALGVARVRGGIHPRFGTRNAIIPLAKRHYLEIVEVLDHPSADKAPFGQAVRNRSQVGGGWMGWCVTVDDLTPYEERLGRKAVPGNRKFPDGNELTWQQIGIKGLIADPQVPYLLRWDNASEDLHPSLAYAPEAALTKLAIAGSRSRVADWLACSEADPFEDVEVEWVAPAGTPGIMSVTFQTPRGEVTI
ncbi:MAG TPA: VOC family protein [Candidatus Nesterenkonia stercoripullorum]|uniref:VOC family protein n=1 Tax=Candidatus Nesterenkonia stercoripullorum TaxID=2838701 RepID=A0A9D2A6P5_9MICC|nr:VOC family protein [Candidatus Nesterenkonia stercoripullorum]